MLDSASASSGDEQAAHLRARAGKLSAPHALHREITSVISASASELLKNPSASGREVSAVLLLMPKLYKSCAESAGLERIWANS